MKKMCLFVRGLPGFIELLWLSFVSHFEAAFKYTHFSLFISESLQAGILLSIKTGGYAFDLPGIMGFVVAW